MKIQEIDDVAEFNAVDQVPNDAAAEEPDSDPCERSALSKFITAPPDQSEHARRDTDEQDALTAEHSPCSAVVVDAAQGKEPWNDGDVVISTKLRAGQPFG